MKRRTFIQFGAAAVLGDIALVDVQENGIDAACEVLAGAVAARQVSSAVLHVRQRDRLFSRAFGAAASDRAMFLLGSISKPIAATAVMTLYDRGEFRLDDPLRKFIPQFAGGGRDDVTLRHLLTHVSGLPDQLPENDELRRRHAPLAEFVDHALRTPLHFRPGSRYRYSSMAILLACRVAELISGTEIRTLVGQTVLKPLRMNDSAQGLGKFAAGDMVRVQTEFAAVEAGGGNPDAKAWDWNSPYWRSLGAPWGGTHASAADVGTFLAEFLHPRGQAVKPETARLMVQNHNPPGIEPRGLGFQVGTGAGSPGCSDRTFGHTGSTGTIAWADPASETICVVLTSLPARAVTPHPRDTAAAKISAASRGMQTPPARD
ncbi:MAG: beta-lactamase family protein [Pirellulaceae bacterium]|nr:beta-lactamase family protein [Pirellulaceae bacterium]